jgi:hypothetical protein
MYALVPTRPDWTRIFHTFCRNENHFILELPVRAAAAGPRSPDGQDFPDFLSCATVWRSFLPLLLSSPCSLFFPYAVWLYWFIVARCTFLLRFMGATAGERERWSSLPLA